MAPDEKKKNHTSWDAISFFAGLDILFYLHTREGKTVASSVGCNYVGMEGTFPLSACIQAVRYVAADHKARKHRTIKEDEVSSPRVFFSTVFSLGLRV